MIKGCTVSFSRIVTVSSSDLFHIEVWFCTDL